MYYRQVWTREMMSRNETLTGCRTLGKPRVYIRKGVWGVSVMSRSHGRGHRLHLHNKIWRISVSCPNGDEPPAWRSFLERVCAGKRTSCLSVMWLLMMHFSYARTLSHDECLILCNEPSHCALLKKSQEHAEQQWEGISKSTDEIQTTEIHREWDSFILLEKDMHYMNGWMDRWISGSKYLNYYSRMVCVQMRDITLKLFYYYYFNTYMKCLSVFLGKKQYI